MTRFLLGCLAALFVMFAGLLFDHITGCKTAFLQGWWGCIAFNLITRKPTLTESVA